MFVILVSAISFISGLLLGVMSIDTGVTANQLTEAYARCSTNQGVHDLRITGRQVIANCTNGARFVLRLKP